MITNGTFDESTVGWGLLASGEAGVSYGGTISYNAALDAMELNGAAGKQVHAYTSLVLSGVPTLEAGQTFRVSASLTCANNATWRVFLMQGASPFAVQNIASGDFTAAGLNDTINVDASVVLSTLPNPGMRLVIALTNTPGSPLIVDNVVASVTPLSIASPAPVFTPNAPQDSIVANGHFDAGITDWYQGQYGGGSHLIEWNAGGWLDDTITVAALNNQVRQIIPEWANLGVKVGDRLTLRFRAKADSPTTIQYISIANNSVYWVSNTSAASLTTEWQTFEFSLTIAAEPVPTGILVFTINSTFAGTWSLDDVRLTINEGAYYNATPGSKSEHIINFDNLPPREPSFYLKEFASSVESTVTTSGQPAPTWVSDGAGGGYISQTFADGALNNSWWLQPFAAGLFPVPIGSYYVIKARIRGTAGATVAIGHVLNGPPYFAQSGEPVDGDGTSAITLTEDWQDVTVLGYRSSAYGDETAIGPYISLSGTQVGTMEMDSLTMFFFNSASFYYDPDGPSNASDPGTVFSAAAPGELANPGTPFTASLPEGSSEPDFNFNADPPSASADAETSFDNTQPQTIEL